MKNTNPVLKTARAPRKSWSYIQLTEATEARIRSHADFLKRMLAENSSNRPNDMYVSQVSNRAYGAFLLWRSTTQDWQDPNDVERLRVLAESLRNAATVHGCLV